MTVISIPRSYDVIRPLRERVVLAISERYRTQNRFCDEIGILPSQFSGFLHDTAPLGDALRRKISEQIKEKLEIDPNQEGVEANLGVEKIMEAHKLAQHRPENYRGVNIAHVPFVYTKDGDSPSVQTLPPVYALIDRLGMHLTNPPSLEFFELRKDLSNGDYFKGKDMGLEAALKKLGRKHEVFPGGYHQSQGISHFGTVIQDNSEYGIVVPAVQLTDSNYDIGRTLLVMTYSPVQAQRRTGASPILQAFVDQGLLATPPSSQGDDTSDFLIHWHEPTYHQFARRCKDIEEQLMGTLNKQDNRRN
ncbi:hypothetical protein HYV86_01445 [Candidatus Woesearchaeota archaeon]|nr:hypothetical protein [Candidatus Woesearchaeota archaeon]